MKKDVIYIDIEDDITSIIEKVKAAKAKVVALVPPKRVGALQSIVNLKLLQRAASAADHHVVLITSDQALSALASGVGIPIAKNLQSKPELMPAILASDDDDDIIDGSELPVGDHAKTVGTPASESKSDSGLTSAAALSAAELDSSKAAASGGGSGSKAKIPNFEKFRKKIFLFSGISVALLLFLIWAIFFAPHATVTIAAKTSGVDVAQPLTLDPALPASDIANGKFKPNVQQIKKTSTAPFTATGTKDIGAKAAGSLTLSNGGFDNVNIPAGTTFVASSNGTQFTSGVAVTVPKVYLCAVGGKPGICNGTASVNVTAANIGPDYNVAPGDFTTNAPVSASSSAAMAGGSKQTITVVSQADIDGAKAKLVAQDANTIKQDVRKQFPGDYIVIDESFSTVPGDPVVAPKLDEQATQATLTVDTTYTLVGIARTDVKQYVEAQVKPTLDKSKNQRIYSDGDDALRFSQFSATASGYSTKMNATAHIGPNIDTTRLAQQIQGKRFGEVQQIVTGYEGVDNVDVRFSPFWVTTVPSPDKTDITFKITNGNN